MIIWDVTAAMGSHIVCHKLFNLTLSWRRYALRRINFTLFWHKAWYFALLWIALREENCFGNILSFDISTNRELAAPKAFECMAEWFLKEKSFLYVFILGFNFRQERCIASTLLVFVIFLRLYAASSFNLKLIIIVACNSSLSVLLGSIDLLLGKYVGKLIVLALPLQINDFFYNPNDLH